MIENKTMPILLETPSIMRLIKIVTDYVRAFKRILLFALLTSMVSGCQTTDFWVKKQSSDVQSEAVEQQIVEQKLSELKQRQQQLSRLQNQAETAFNIDDYDVAQQHYQQMLAIDEFNLIAKEGLRRVNQYGKHPAMIKEAKMLVAKKNEQSDKEAAELLRTVLIENPNDNEATQLYQGIIDRADAKRAEALRLKLNYKNKVSLEFRDTEIRVIIEALAKGTGVNFVLDKDVKKNLKASLFVRNVTLDEAIDMLVQSNQLRKKILSQDSVLIYPDSVAKVKQYQDMIIRSFYLEYANPATVSGLLKSMLGMKQIQIDERLPMIMIKDVPEVMVLAEKLIKSQDVPEPEVMLEVNVLEVRRSAITDQGVRWPTQLSVLSTGTLTVNALKDVDSTKIGVSPNPALIFDGQNTNANLLANPRIRVKNKEKAQIHIGDRVPVITSNVSSNGVISDNVQYIDSGIKLDVEPVISAGGDVTIKLKLDVSSIGEKVTTKSGAVVPQIGTRSTSTQLRLQDGETQVLAGLINDEDRKTVNKIPGLGDLPMLGRFFSKHNDDRSKTELILTITPHIIRPVQSTDAGLANYWMGTDSQVGRGQTGPQPRSREELSKLFRVGKPPTNKRKTAPAEKQQTAPPTGLNMTLPPGLTSSF